MPYNDWPHLLQECSIALSIHFDTVETRLAFRSRRSEYIWAGIPIISTQGDATSELIAKYSLGHIVDYEDVDGIALAITHILEKKEYSSADFEGARQALAWERSAAPLIAFCKEPIVLPIRSKRVRRRHCFPVSERLIMILSMDCRLNGKPYTGTRLRTWEK